MELRIKDRLLIPALFPKEGTFLQYNLKTSIISKIEISEAERKELSFNQDETTGSLTWDVSKDVPFEPMFTQDEMAYLKESCEKLADQTLSDDMWGTVKKIYDNLTEEA